MSEALIEHSFPLKDQPRADRVVRIVKESLYAENTNPFADDWSDEAILYTRSSWSSIRQSLDDLGIVLTPAEQDELMEFSSEYASLVDQEEGIAELNAMRNEGEQ